MKILRFFIYHTVGFVCEVLICMNSARYRGLADFNSTVMLIILSFFQSVIATHVTIPCLVIWLLFVSLQVLQESIVRRHFDSSCSGWSKRPGLLQFFHHSDSTALLQCNWQSTKHQACKCGILWSYSLLCRILLQPSGSAVGTGGPEGYWPHNVHRWGLAPLQTLEGYNIIIIMPLSTKAIIYSSP